MVDKYFRSLFIPSLNGQEKIWKNVITKEASVCDEVYQFGNIIGLTDYAKDKEKHGHNNNILRYIMLFRSTLDNWVQLIGPNEIAALNNPNEWTNQNSRKILRESWVGKVRSMRIAAVSRGRLLTHGGLTYGEWVNIGRPDTAQEAADLLNKKYFQTLKQGDAFNLGAPPNYAANPIWAHVHKELIPSWITTTERLPFDQMHGSGSLNNLDGRAAFDSEESILQYVDKVRYKRWGSSVTIRDQIITSLDLELPNKLLPSLENNRLLYIEEAKNL